MFSIAVFLVVLGVLVFVHELGHFVAAKMCGVYVDRFSLGMPPRLFGFKWGDTDYCIGLLPIGGYVKMAGQEDAPLSDEEREETYGHVPPEQWYNNKTKLQRAFILIAGPAMNLVLGFVIYAGIFAVGTEMPAILQETRVGAVVPESPASEAKMYPKIAGEQINFNDEPATTGWQVGDRIISINGTEMTGFQEIFTSAVLSGGDETTVEIDRTTESGETQRYVSLISPRKLDPEDEIVSFGFDVFQSALVEHVLPLSPAEQQGIQSGDRILTANGEVVDSTAFSKKVQELEPGESLSLVIERDGERVELDLSAKRKGRINGIAFDPPLNQIIGIPDDQSLPIAATDPEFLASIGLNYGDTIESINGNSNLGTELRRITEDATESTVELALTQGGQAILSTADAVRAITGVDPASVPEVRAVTSEVKDSLKLNMRDKITHINGEPATIERLEKLQQDRIGESIPVTVDRPAILFGLYQKQETFETEIPIDEIQQVGVVWRQERVFHREPLANVIPAAWTECVRRADEIRNILGKLFTGGLSPRLLGGPVLIFEITTQTAKRGAYEFLSTVAFISINLCIFNLLPLPVLDGGQLTILAIEAIRRRPISVKVLETVQGAGLFFIIGLLLFVTFNDVDRILQRLLP